MPGSGSSWKDDLFLKIINVLVYFLFLGSNVYIVTAPGDIYYAGRQTCELPSYSSLELPVTARFPARHHPSPMGVHYLVRLMSHFRIPCLTVVSRSVIHLLLLGTIIY